MTFQAGRFVGARAAFVVGIAVGVVVSLVTSPKPEAELVGLVWSLTPRSARIDAAADDETGWYRSPVVLGSIVIALVVVLYLLVP